MTQNNLATIIWLDSNANDSYSSFLSKLKSHQYVQTFIEIHPCASFINEHTGQTIILIVSGSFAPQIVPLIYDCPNVPMIFVFCASMKAHADWAMGFCDKLMMFDHEDDLLQRLWFYLEEYSREEGLRCMRVAEEYKERANALRKSCG